MKRQVMCLPAIAILLVSATQPISPVLTHSGPWNVHSSENACMLARPFGTTDAETLVAFQPLFGATTGELFVMTKDKRAGQKIGTATVAEYPAGQIETAPYFSNRLPHESKRVTRITIPRATWEGLGATDILSITAPPISVRVKLVRFTAAKVVFDECEAKMLREWGVDPTAIDPDHAPAPMQKPARYFGTDAYPPDAIRAGHLGRVVAIVNVDQAGSVTDCRIGSRSWPELNEATCKQARRIRFTPGRDTAGRPVAAIFLLPVRWLLPGF